MSESTRRQLGDDWTSPLGFRWLWNERLGCYACATPGCAAREADGHSDECCLLARGREEKAA